MGKRQERTEYHYQRSVLRAPSNPVYKGISLLINHGLAQALMVPFPLPSVQSASLGAASILVL